MYSVHEMVAATRWAWANGTWRPLSFGEYIHQVDKPARIIETMKEWCTERGVWGNYELNDVQQLCTTIDPSNWLVQPMAHGHLQKPPFPCGQVCDPHPIQWPSNPYYTYFLGPATYVHCLP